METTKAAPSVHARADVLAKLREDAYRIRRYALQMGEVQGQGYIAQALGIADALAVAWGHALRYRADDPAWEGRDRFLLSHGHYAIALYAALIRFGFLPERELQTYGADDSRLPMSGMATYTPGMEMSGGSLGHGLAIGVGMALALRLKSSRSLVYVSMSDGELNEGSVWEAAQSASHHRLANLVNLVDINDQQADGPCSAILGFEPAAARWEAFGWYAQDVDGNDLGAVLDAFERARHHGAAQPRVILLRTRLGRGVGFLEARERNHFMRVDAHEWQQAIAELDQRHLQGEPA